jgi:cell division septal protein FtsQ
VKKILIIVVIVQFVFTALFLLYALALKSEADMSIREVQVLRIKLLQTEERCRESTNAWKHQADSLQKIIQVTGR